MTDRGGIGLPRIPAHVVVLLSASTAGYAVALAGVTALQSQHEAALIAQRSPTVAGVDALATGHDDLASRLESARDRYTRAAGAMDDVTSVLQAVDLQLEQLAASVAEIDGVSRTLPTSVRIPAPRVVRHVQAPATHATTGASGG
jgi:hypothetical protein